VASRIPANVEQMPQNAIFFDPHDERELATQLSEILDTPPQIVPSDYSAHQKGFARSFFAVLNEVATENALAKTELNA
jgi:hypothetical protein